MAPRNKMLSQYLRQQQKLDGGEHLEQSWEDKQEQGLVLGPLLLCLLAPTWAEILQTLHFFLPLCWQSNLKPV